MLKAVLALSFFLISFAFAGNGQVGSVGGAQGTVLIRNKARAVNFKASFDSNFSQSNSFSMANFVNHKFVFDIPPEMHLTTDQDGKVQIQFIGGDFPQLKSYTLLAGKCYEFIDLSPISYDLFAVDCDINVGKTNLPPAFAFHTASM